MDKWKLNLKSGFLKSLYENYLARIDQITTLYSIVALSEQQISSNPESLDDSIEIPLSTNFGSWATIKNKRDIINGIESGKIHQFNCYQTVVSLVANFENLIDRLISHFSITKNEITSATPISLNGNIASPLLKKVHAIHTKLSIRSNVIGKHETGYYYKIIRVRNCIVHRQGIPNSSESTLLVNWTSNDCVVFDKNQIDDFVHFFLMPLSSMIIEMDKRLAVNVE